MSLVVAIDARLVGGTNTGDSSYWTGLLDGFVQLGDDSKLILISDIDRPPDLPWSDRFSWMTVPRQFHSGWARRWWSLVQFPAAVRRAGADIAHVQYSISPIMRRPTVTTVHDVSFMIGPEWFQPKDRILLRTTVPAACRRAARVITVSNTSRQELEREIPASQGKVVATPLACPSWIRHVEPERARSEVERQIGVRDPYLLTVGTRWPRKNMGLAIAASARLPERMPHRMLVTGKTGWGDAELGPRGRATGYVDSHLLSCLYSAADLYLAPSRHEGFGIPILEAFRCGCPVVCSTGGAIPEVAGDAAIIEPTWDADHWAATVERAIGDPGTLGLLRERGFVREREFTWAETARRTMNVYREVAT